MPFINIADLRERARRRLPRMFFDYLDGGAFGETTLRRNRADFEALTVEQQVLIDVGTRDLSHTFLGRPSRLPLMLAPIGFCGMFRGRGEVLAARAAAAAGIGMCLSNFAITGLERVTEAAGAAPDFQIYIFRRRDLSEAMMARAEAAGSKVLFVTVDTPLSGLRERDTRNGFRTAARLGARPMADMLLHPSWCLDIARAGKPLLGNWVHLPEFGSTLMEQASRAGTMLDPTLSWKDVAWLRSRWKGTLAVKGILSAGDARRAADAGADAIVVSNHGGRQLDGARSTIDVLPEIAAAVGGRCEVLLDSGIRRGSDIVKAIGLGADGVLIGRAYIYGLAAAGEAGVAAALALLTAEMDLTMGMMGVRTIAELKAAGPELIRRSGFTTHMV